MGVATMADKRTLYVTFVDDAKQFEANLSLISTDWLRLRAAQVPRCRDMAIFVVTTDRLIDRQIDMLYLCACARGNYY